MWYRLHITWFINFKQFTASSVVRKFYIYFTIKYIQDSLLTFFKTPWKSSTEKKLKTQEMYVFTKEKGNSRMAETFSLYTLAFHTSSSIKIS